MFGIIKDKPVITLAVAIFISIAVLVILSEAIKKYDENKFKTKLEQYTVKVKKEADRRESTNPENFVTPDGHIGPKPTPERVRDNDWNTDIIPEGELYFTSGPYAGMTYDQAMKEWNRQNSELHDRDTASVDKLLAHGRAEIVDTDKEIDAILSLYKLFSIEQLEQMRAEALRIYPEETVNEFFNEISNLDSRKTPEELRNITAGFAETRAAQETAMFELRVEREQIKRDRESLAKIKPSNFRHLLSIKE